MVHKEDLLEMFITYELEDLYGDFSDDGDGKLELTEKGNEVATTLIKLIEQEIDKAREEGRRETLLEMQREFSEYGVPDDVRYTHPLFYINNIIEEKLSKLKQ